MASTSPDPPAIEGSPVSSIKTEIHDMVKIVKMNGGIKDTVIITVVRTEADVKLQRKLDKKTIRELFGKTASLFITTGEKLQAAIDRIPKRCSKRLVVLVTPMVDGIVLHVASSFNSLEIFRCPQKENDEGRLLVEGASTFNGVRFDKWQAKKHSHSLCLGERVFIDVDLPTAPPLWPKPFDSLSSVAPNVVRENIGLMIRGMKSRNSGEPWWEIWKDPVTALMKYLLDGACFDAAAAIRVTEHGFYAAFKFAAIVEKASTETLKSGKAVLGVGKAPLLIVPKLKSALYFISWNNIFKMIKGAVFQLCGHLWETLRKILVWIAETFAGCGLLAEVLLP